jgi:hypothetical protein
MTTRQDLILATIRTAVPAAVAWMLAQLIALIPAVADVIAAADDILTVSAPGWTVQLLLTGAAIGLVGGAYYWVVRKLGARWPIVERFLLGSVRQPVAYIDGRAAGVQIITTVDPDRSALEHPQED